VNSLAQTIDAASSSTQEAQVESTVSPPPLHERQSRPESAAGEPIPLSAPQAENFRSGPRATRFAAAALLSSLGSRSCCSQQRSSSTACRSRACERASLLFTSCTCFRFFAFIPREGGGCGGRKNGGQGAGGGGGRGRAASRRCGLRRETPTMPQRGTLRKFWRSCSAGGGSWGL
jgi:hypothetical protein